MAMLIAVDGIAPTIGRDVYLAPNAVLTGDVRIGDRASVWFGAVLRGDLSHIVIGAETSIQDGAVVHCDRDNPTVVGARVTVGHNALLEGCVIEDGALIGMGAIVLHDAHVGAGAVVADGAVVPDRGAVGARMLAAGIPAREAGARGRDGGLPRAPADACQDLRLRYLRAQEAPRIRQDRPLSSMAMSAEGFGNITLVGTGRRAAVVGAGPSGFYAADQLLAAGFEVDLYDALPTPFGLVRAGRRARPPEDQVGHARLREDRAAQAGLPLLRRRRARRATSRARSCSSATTRSSTRSARADDNRLGIPGEDRPGSLRRHRVRRLVQRPPGRAPTRSSTSSARARRRDRQRQRGDRRRADARARPRRARGHRHRRPRDRGVRAAPASRRSCSSAAAAPRRPRSPTPSCASSASSSAPTSTSTRPSSSSTPSRAPWLESEGDPTAKRNVEMLREYAAREPHGQATASALRFLRSPVEILGEGDDGRVTGVRVVRNRIERGDDGRLRAVPTGEEEVIECGLVAALDRLPRPAARRHPVRRAPRPDPQRRAAASATRTASRSPASTPSAGSSAARAASSARTRRTRPTRSPGSSRTPRPAACPSPPRTSTTRRAARGCATPRPGSSSGTAGRRSTSTSAAWASRRAPARQARPARRAGRGRPPPRGGGQGRRSLNAAIGRSTASGSSNIGLWPAPSTTTRSTGPWTRLRMRSICSSVP